MTRGTLFLCFANTSGGSAERAGGSAPLCPYRPRTASIMLCTFSGSASGVMP